MPMDKGLWEPAFSQGDLPHFVCPRCGKGRLDGVDESLVIEEPSHSSIARKNNPNIRPHQATHRFSLRMKCGLAKCGEIVVMCGDTVATTVEEPAPEFFAWVHLLRPQAMFPAPPIITVPEEAP